LRLIYAGFSGLVYTGFIALSILFWLAQLLDSKQLSHSANENDSLHTNYFVGLDLCSVIKRKVQAALNERMQEYKRQIDQESRLACNGSNGSLNGDGIQAIGRSSH
jgi:hypothetical protein